MRERTHSCSVVFCLIVLLMACGGSPVNEGENYGNLLSTDQGLVLTEGEHEAGWGRSDCTLCHNLENIHRINRTGIPIDIDAIHDQALSDGIASCATCHGTNGVP
ncbi:MAG: hypothetical protein HYS22_04835 [Deltaproteobacteria bacterium]|nr:hypothetical protein [Deltaproteobacteria bacterium]